ncbi:hypothetical protein N431DRAFT_80858 [Stipitochalara longipes BDJ]|nr:hypothetical protein N431DRAFT_80858 [Stipitochalara longipes BDJ]
MVRYVLRLCGTGLSVLCSSTQPRHQRLIKNMQQTHWRSIQQHQQYTGYSKYMLILWMKPNADRDFPWRRYFRIVTTSLSWSSASTIQRTRPCYGRTWPTRLKSRDRVRFRFLISSIVLPMGVLWKFSGIPATQDTTQ